MNAITEPFPKLIDFHCHLDLFLNPAAVIKECEDLKINVLTMTNAPRVWKQNKELTKGCGYVRVALGLHPQLAHEMRNEITLFERYLNESRYIGEVGLDGSLEHMHNMSTQLDVFITILKLCASFGNKILSVHSRRASRKVIDLLAKHLPQEKGRVVLHWFTGTKKEAIDAVSMGCFFSVNSKMLMSSNTKLLLEVLPLERILTETDAPFIKNNNDIIYPKNVLQTVRQLSLLLSIPVEKIIKQIHDNLVCLIREI